MWEILINKIYSESQKHCPWNDTYHAFWFISWWIWLKMVSIAPPGCMHELEADENIKKGATNRLPLGPCSFPCFPQNLVHACVSCPHSTRADHGKNRWGRSRRVWVWFVRKRPPLIPTISIKSTFLCVSLYRDTNKHIIRLNDSISAHPREQANALDIHLIVHLRESEHHRAFFSTSDGSESWEKQISIPLLLLMRRKHV
jgi:hypothetical protein